MASCEITATGSSGQAILKYKIGTNNYSTIVNIGDPIYIDDTASDVIFTRISGDIAVSSGCIAVTEVEYVCYIFKWESKGIPTNFTFVSLLHMDGEQVIDEVPFDLLNLEDLATSINKSSERIKAIAGKTEVQNDRLSGFHYLKIRSIGFDIPFLKIRNTGTPFFLYLVPDPDSCSIDSGFTEFNICESEYISTTTTTTTT